MLTMTGAAAEAVREIAQANDLPAGSGLRITAEQEGDELTIDLDFVEEAPAGDDVVEESGARVYLDTIASEVLAETELDVEVHDDHVHFRFNGLDDLVE